MIIDAENSMDRFFFRQIRRVIAIVSIVRRSSSFTWQSLQLSAVTE
jgi:hypothetical protein